MAAVHMRPGCGSLPDTGIICSWGTDRGDATRRSQHDISHLSVHFHAICSCLNKIIHYLYRHHYWKDKDAGKILLRQTDGICRVPVPTNSVCVFFKEPAHQRSNFKWRIRTPAIFSQDAWTQTAPISWATAGIP